MTADLQNLTAVVQYRRKDGGHPWVTMAAFDVAGAAEKYCDQQSKLDSCPWEYRWLELEGV